MGYVAEIYAALVTCQSRARVPDVSLDYYPLAPVELSLLTRYPFPPRLAKGHVFGMEKYLAATNFAVEECATGQAVRCSSRRERTNRCPARRSWPQLWQGESLAGDDVDRKLC